MYSQQHIKFYIFDQISPVEKQYDFRQFLTLYAAVRTVHTYVLVY